MVLVALLSLSFSPVTADSNEATMRVVQTAQDFEAAMESGTPHLHVIEHLDLTSLNTPFFPASSFESLTVRNHFACEHDVHMLMPGTIVQSCNNVCMRLDQAAFTTFLQALDKLGYLKAHGQCGASVKYVMINPLCRATARLLQAARKASRRPSRRCRARRPAHVSSQLAPMVCLAGIRMTTCQAPRQRRMCGCMGYMCMPRKDHPRARSSHNRLARQWFGLRPMMRHCGSLTSLSRAAGGRSTFPAGCTHNVRARLLYVLYGTALVYLCTC